MEVAVATRTMVEMVAVVNVVAIVGRVVSRSKNAAVAASRPQLLKTCPRKRAFTGLSRLKKKDFLRRFEDGFAT